MVGQLLGGCLMDNKQGVVGSSCRNAGQLSITAVFIVAAVFVCLACQCALLSKGYCGVILQQARGLIVDDKSQLSAICVVATFTAILVAGRVYTMRRFAPSDFWFSALLVISLINYVQHHDSVFHFSGAIVFFGGFLVGELVRQKTIGSDSPNRWRLAIAVVVLVSILVTAVCQTGVGEVYRYRGALRWCGGWDNPNTCGLLMGVAAVLAWGLLRYYVTCNHGNEARPFKGAMIVVLVIVQIGILIGLVATYSRGAWLGTAIALIYFQFVTYKCEQVRLPRLVKAVFVVAAIVVVCVAVAASVHQSESAVVRRVVSPASAHDFSSRNRVSAWIAGLQIMADHPWRGVGWNSPQICYDAYYKPAEVQAATAIETNDYIYIGAALGIPALIVLFSYLWTIVARSWAGRIATTSNPAGLHLSCTLTAAAIVLAVGFAFDGGLMSLPTGIAFWVLANAGDHSI